MDETDALHALDMGWNDYEDALQAAAAQRCEAELIITGNVTDFSTSPVPVMTAADFLSRYPAAPGSREKFDRILARVPDAPPQEGDELPH